MSLKILDGKKISKEVRTELRQRVEHLRQYGIVPSLRILLVGENPASELYVANKVKAAAEVGIEALVVRRPSNIPEAEAQAVVQGWNEDSTVHGIIVQLPLPKHISERKLLDLVVPAKDVDGLGMSSMGALACGQPGFRPATPAGIIELLVRNGIGLSGKRVVIVGRGGLVGKPLAMLLLMRGVRGDATVTVCHSQTRDLSSVCKIAEILVASAGCPRLINGEMVSEGVVVVDAGTNTVAGKLVGDVDYDSVAAKASAITPVPGGVGPMTVAMLLANVVQAAEQYARTKGLAP